MDKQLLYSMSMDRALAQAMLFSHRHKQATPPFHLRIFDLWRSSNEYVSIEAFREGGKTTLSEEFLIIEALFHNFNYLLIFGETYTKACQRITAIKHEIINNPVISKLFGNQRKSSNVWAENKILLANGVFIEAHGWEEEIRGYKYLDFRPDRAYLDDIETLERVRSTGAVDSNWRKIHLELIPAMDKDSGKIRMTGTPLADDCLLTRARGSENWVSEQFPICDLEYKESLWPGRYSIDWIKRRRDQFAAEGLLRSFLQEYMLVPMGAQAKPFSEEDLVFEPQPPRAIAPATVILDPARTTDIKSSDQTGFVVVRRVGSRFYVLDSNGAYWKPDEIISNAYRLSHEHEDCTIAIEKNSLDEWLLQPMRAYALTHGQFSPIKALNAPQDRTKAEFILGLQAFFKSGSIVLCGGREAHKVLVSQILNFPSGKRDVLNALAYVLRIYSGVLVYPEFSEQNIRYEYAPARGDSLLLALNSTNSHTTAVLLACSGLSYAVLADWVSDLMPGDMVPDVAALVRSAYPGYRLSAYAPLDVMERIGRNPLAVACAAVKLPLRAGDSIVQSRQGLTELMRTQRRGVRMFSVCDSARMTIAALAQEYQWAVRANGERAPEPERGAHKTLIEAVECLIQQAKSATVLENSFSNNSVNINGVPYMSALARGKLG